MFMFDGKTRTRILWTYVGYVIVAALVGYVIESYFPMTIDW